MKVRNGFVSNSSSSSFIVGFKKKPETSEELREMMFGDLDGQVMCYDWSIPIEKVVERVFEDFQNKTPMKGEEILESVSSGFFEGYPEWPPYVNGETNEERERKWKDHDKEVEKAAEKHWNALKSKFDGLEVYEFEYGDERGEGVLEHGGIFDKLPHIVISHH